jgi:4-nitrophenyl phosphatase
MAIDHLIIDMDGVLWQGETPMPGLAGFFAGLEDSGFGFVLATNNATRTPEQYQEKLGRFGLAIPGWRIVNSAEATAGYLQSHFPASSAVYVVGEAGLRQAIAGRGFVLAEADDPGVTAVVVGLHRQVCYADLAAATLLIRGGAAFLGTNPDPSLPTERGQLPGAGALLAFLEAASGVRPTIIGKPGRALFEEALRRLQALPGQTAVVGDRLATDIAGGKAAGLATILLLSGVTLAADLANSAVQPDWVFSGIGELTANLARVKAGT